MKATEALDEIRKAREEIARRCDFDPRKLVDFYLERQNKKLMDSRKDQVASEHLFATPS